MQEIQIETATGIEIVNLTGVWRIVSDGAGNTDIFFNETYKVTAVNISPRDMLKKSRKLSAEE